MGYMMCHAPCFGCGRIFSFNASCVPSFQGKPVCGNCMARANAKRAEMGQPPHPIHPDAYEPEEVA